MVNPKNGGAEMDDPKMGGGEINFGVFFLGGGDCTIMYNKILEDTQNGSGAELF